MRARELRVMTDEELDEKMVATRKELFISEHCPFLASLRREPRFGEILAETKRRSDAFIV